MVILAAVAPALLAVAVVPPAEAAVPAGPTQPVQVENAAAPAADQTPPAPVQDKPAASASERPPTATQAPAPATPQPPSGDTDEIVVAGRLPSPADPLAKFNAKSYQVIQGVDRAFVGPAAKVYEKGLPGPVRSGLRNFLRNLEEPVSALNYVLQLKPGRAVKSIARFGINSTIGVAGLVDVAKRKPFHLPYRPNGFANTFACYGIGPGPYFFLPLVGPITLRDGFGLLLDRAAIPLAVGRPFNRPVYAITAGVIDELGDRVEEDAELKELREKSPDPYVATRELYLKQRRAEIGAICPRHGDAVPDPKLPPRVGKGVD